MALDQSDGEEMAEGKDDIGCRLDSGQGADLLDMAVGDRIEYSHMENLAIDTVAKPDMDNHKAAVDIAAMVMAVTVMFVQAQSRKTSSERESPSKLQAEALYSIVGGEHSMAGAIR